MFRLRTVPTKSGSFAIQVVSSGGHDIVVVKHIGSGKTDEELTTLKKLGLNWIEHHSPQMSLFPVSKLPLLISQDNLEPVATYPRLIHQLCLRTFDLLGFTQAFDRVILDITFMLLVEPASKATSIELLGHEFGINHSIATLKRKLKSVAESKAEVEKQAIAYAKKYLHFDFSVVLYDVTTLYYESFKADDQGEGIRFPGFSKDNKSHQPQITLGLLVTTQGFPLSFRTFAGNKFEGHTLIPSLVQLQRRHDIKSLTVVADAAMISSKNIKELKQKGMGYIVAARTSGLAKDLIDRIDKKLEREDKATIRLSVEDTGWLVCQFSYKRYRKDKSDTEKQVAKAKLGIKHPAKGVKRFKFIRQVKAKAEKGGKKDDKSTDLEFNRELWEKTQKLWGIKGYFTDQEHLTDQEIIDQYHNLWQVEKSFRMSKSDLKTRPIYHYKTINIIAHLVICFMALCTAKHWEMQTGMTIKKLVRLLKKIRDVDLKDTLTDHTFTARRKLTPEEQVIVEKLN